MSCSNAMNVIPALYSKNLATHQKRFLHYHPMDKIRLIIECDY